MTHSCHVQHDIIAAKRLLYQLFHDYTIAALKRRFCRNFTCRYGIMEGKTWRYLFVIESRCGLLCGDCLYREQMGCKGCVNMDKPFWADSCPVKSCCEARKHQHCGKCDSFVCPLLHTFAYDMEQSDNGARIEQCKKWRKE